MSKKIFTKEEFFEYYYENKKLPQPLINWGNKKLFNDNQLNTKYKEYLKKLEPKQNIKNEKLQQTTDACKLCHEINDKSIFYNFYNKCSKEEQKMLDSKMKGYLGSQWDAAHIISRSSSTKLASNIDNLVLLPHFIHLDIDNFIDPRNNKRLTAETHEKLWKEIIGIEKYEKIKYGN